MAKILIIDDNNEFREMLKELLQGSGYEVFDAADGNSGLDICHKDHMDLVISDIIMPAKDGIDVMLELKRDFPDLKIIAISGGGRGNASDYLSVSKMLKNVKYTFRKPFDNEELLKAIKAILGV